ncbi:unnamed protein product, partial [Bubo scandiacus]
SCTLLYFAGFQHMNTGIYYELLKSIALLLILPMAFGSCFADPTLLQTPVTRT